MPRLKRHHRGKKSGNGWMAFLVVLSPPSSRWHLPDGLDNQIERVPTTSFGEQNHANFSLQDTEVRFVFRRCFSRISERACGSGRFRFGRLRSYEER